MALQLALTDSHGANLPTAYGVVTDWTLLGAPQIAKITLSWYVSKAAYAAGFDPFRVDHLALTTQEQAGGVAQLIGLLYSIIQARSDYAQTVSV